MKTLNVLLIAFFYQAILVPISAQEEGYNLNLSVSVDEEIRSEFKPTGRLFIVLSTSPSEKDIDGFWPGVRNRHFIFAKNFTDWDASEPMMLQEYNDWSSWGRTERTTLYNIPKDTFYVQLVWKQVFEGCFTDPAPGNIYSKKQKLVLDKDQSLNITLSEVIEETKLMDHPHMKMVTYKSDTLSKWWGKPIYERAAVLLPSGYFDNPGKEYPIFYYIGGGDSDCIRTIHMRWNRFSDSEWWMTEGAPQVIIVFLDGTKNANIYHLDSDILGPHGYSLTNEFIPYIEKMYRGTDSPDTRYIGGCSTGGYGSLAQQLFYPEFYNGVYCYSPDPVYFGYFFNLNIYGHSNTFTDKYGYPRMFREYGVSGLPISWKDWIDFENTLSYSGSYMNSGHFIGIMSSIFGPIGGDGKRVPLIDPNSGDINQDVVKSWERYDLEQYTQRNWSELGPKLRNKVYICVEDNDDWNFNITVRSFHTTISRLSNPTPDMVFEYSGLGHCGPFNMNFRKIIYNIESNGKPGDMSKIEDKWEYIHW
jgi:hypothetical protein